MANPKISEVNNGDFDSKVLGAETPVLVDFWAAWCGPCRAVAPTLDELADDYDGKVSVAKVNIDDNRELAAKYSVQSIPTFLLIKDGEVADRMMGAAPKAAFEQFINRNVES